MARAYANLPSLTTSHTKQSAMLSREGVIPRSPTMAPHHQSRYSVHGTHVPCPMYWEELFVPTVGSWDCPRPSEPYLIVIRCQLVRGGILVVEVLLLANWESIARYVQLCATLFGVRRSVYKELLGGSRRPALRITVRINKSYNLASFL